MKLVQRVHLRATTENNACALSLTFYMNCQKTQNLNFEVNSLSMKVVKTTLSVLVLSVLTLKSYTQILVNGDSLFGNEWIDYDLSYHKIKVTGMENIFFTQFYYFCLLVVRRIPTLMKKE